MENKNNSNNFSNHDNDESNDSLDFGLGSESKSVKKIEKSVNNSNGMNNDKCLEKEEGEIVFEEKNQILDKNKIEEEDISGNEFESESGQDSLMADSSPEKNENHVILKNDPVQKQMSANNSVSQDSLIDNIDDPHNNHDTSQVQEKIPVKENPNINNNENPKTTNNVEESDFMKAFEESDSDINFGGEETPPLEESHTTKKSIEKATLAPIIKQENILNQTSQNSKISVLKKRPDDANLEYFLDLKPKKSNKKKSKSKLKKKKKPRKV
jgi:hypothetical protein